MALYGCFQSSTYTMLIDIMGMNISQDHNTGEFRREWVVDETVACLAKTIIEDSASKSAAGKDFSRSFKERYDIKLKTANKISTRKKVTNIRDAATGLTLFTENKIDEDPTIYDVEASVPVFDPFGKVIYYDTLVCRSDVQYGN